MKLEQQCDANNTMNGEAKQPLKLNLQLFAEDPAASGGEAAAATGGSSDGASDPAASGGEPAAGAAQGSEADTAAGSKAGGDEGKDPSGRIDMFGQKDSETKDDDQKADDGQSEQKPDVPEKYEYELPEGIEITPELDAKFTEIAKGLGLNQEQANKLIGLHTSILQSQIADHEKQIDAWAGECKQRGLTGKEQLSDAVRAVDTFGGGEFKDLLIQTGLQNHPAMQHFLQNIGGLLREDTGTSGDKGHSTEDLHSIFFPNSPKI